MSLRRHALLLAATMPAPLLTGACSGPPPASAEGNQVGSMGAPAADVGADQSLPPADAAPPADVAAREAGYVGRWTGVEGMVLDVTAKIAGGVHIENQWDLDHKGSFDGWATPAGLSFVRDGATVTAKRSDGRATGLKYLAGKKDCLTVMPGEGYCRD
ncbi:MAG: hypothetical protein V4659_09920 [Pseudomonadota bacterium]